VIDTVEAPVEIELKTNRSPFRLNWEVDLPIIVSGMVIAGAPRYMGIDFDRNLSQFDPGEINKIDRLALGHWSTSADSISDMLLTSQVILPFVLDFVDVMSSDSSDGLEGFAKDSLILVETLAVNYMAFNLAKFTIRRPRPYTYSLQYQPDQDHGTSASLSFFSGHTSMAFSMATSYSFLFSKRHPDSPLVLPVWIGSHALAAATAGLRIQAGKHFWSDVVAGAVVGSLIGYLVPYLHTGPFSDEYSSGRLMVTPMIYDGGFGTSATWLF
jgi:membrane-associated phospholipid phosphatase